MAYRGRLLVELESKLGEEIDKPLEKMKGPELVRVQVMQMIYILTRALRHYTCSRADVANLRGTAETHLKVTGPQIGCK